MPTATYPSALSSRRPLVERLETRQLLCGYHTGEAVAAAFDPATAVDPFLPTASAKPAAAATTAPAANEATPTPRAAEASPRAAGPGTWATGPSSPIAIGEAAVGVINNKLYVVSQNTKATLRYDTVAKTWSSALAQRPIAGDHHAAEVVNGKLYLIGGLTEYRGLTEPAGRVQIYNPSTNSWSFGKDLPWKGGSVSTAVINNQIYAAGGIVGSKPGAHAGTGSTTQVARYNPSNNTWTMLPSMPKAANHAAAGTYGGNLYVFGGRGGANYLGNGFATSQLFNVAQNRWYSSDTSSAIRALPVGRGGMGKVAFANGELYVFGGETQNGPGATSKNVYSRVDVYNPTTKTWRAGKPIPTAVHGTYPRSVGGAKIYLVGGGTFAGFSQSKILQVYTPG